MEKEERPLPRKARFGLVALGIAIGLIVAEGAASHFRGGAFPMLSIYEDDPARGVRLMANASARLRTPGGNVSEIRTNELGFRGSFERERWFGSRERVMVVGDSQVVGFHCSEEEAFGSRLRNADRQTLLAAAPTWGPIEYLETLHQLADLRPTHILYVANLANDWNEIDAPNRLRTRADYGWARHAQSPPPSWLDGALRRSHAYNLFRQLSGHLQERGEQRTDAIDQLRMRASTPYRGRFQSSLGANLHAANEVSREIGAQLSLVILPLDVQVHPSEWRKYRSRPRPMQATHALIEALENDAEALQIPHLNLVESLRSASPGAFLEDDYHLSPRGHAAVAEAIETELFHVIQASPPPLSLTARTAAR